MYRSVENCYEPSDMLRAKAEFGCEMSREDHGFLCGIIKTLKPRKIVEIGVAEGGTTSVVVNALCMCADRKSKRIWRAKRRLYSIDLNERFYLDTQHSTGYIYEKMKHYIDFSSIDLEHQFLFGKTIAGQIEKIGKNIDMAIIDTTHRLPGEILDFLCILPYMKKGGIIVLHDVNLNYVKTFSSDPYDVSIANVRMATKILLSMAKGNKYINFTDNECMNIGAVEIDDTTLKYADDLFMMLTGTWDYVVSLSDLEDYRKIYEKTYKSVCLNIYDIAVKENKTIRYNTELAYIKNGLEHISAYLPYESLPYLSKIAIYGAGDIGKSLRLWTLLTGYNVVTCWVDDSWKSYGYEMIQAPHTLRNADFDYLIIAEENVEAFFERRAYLVSMGFAAEEQIIQAKLKEELPIDELYIPQFVFPYSKITTGSSVCLYTVEESTDVGKDIYCSVTQSNYCKISGWVDEKYEDSVNDLVKAPEKMLQMDFDYVLVCTVKQSIFEKVKIELERNGWNKGKQIIGLY